MNVFDVVFLKWLLKTTCKVKSLLNIPKQFLQRSKDVFFTLFLSKPAQSQRIYRVMKIFKKI